MSADFNVPGEPPGGGESAAPRRGPVFSRRPRSRLGAEAAQRASDGVSLHLKFLDASPERLDLRACCRQFGAEQVFMADLCLQLERPDDNPLPYEEREKLVTRLVSEYGLVESRLNHILNEKAAA